MWLLKEGPGYLASRKSSTKCVLTGLEESLPFGEGFQETKLKIAHILEFIQEGLSKGLSTIPEEAGGQLE